MNRYLGLGIATIFSFGGLSGAMAADMPIKAPPMVAPVSNWSGFYIGANAGVAFNNQSGYDYVMPFTAAGNIGGPCGLVGGAPVLTAPNPFNLSSICSGGSSFIGGGQLGYNWQQGTYVFGLEADGAWQKIIANSFYRFGSNPTAGAPMGSVAGDSAYFRSEMDSLGTFRGRIGWSGGPWMLYATGGLAVGGVSGSATEILNPGLTCTVAPSAGCRNGTNSDTKFGWTVGAGAELMLDRNWSVGLEYLYADLGNSTITLAALPAATSAFFPTASTVRFHEQEQIVRFKFNYHFNEPIMARY